MIYSDLPSIYKNLSALKKLYRLLIVCAKDPFFMEDCIDRYVLLGKSEGCFVEKVSVSSLFMQNEAITEPFSLISQPQLYIVEAGKIGAEEQKQCIQLFNNARPDCFFLLLQEDFSEEFSACAKKEGAVYAYPSLKPWEKTPYIVQWIKAFCVKRNGTIAIEAASLLATHLSDDQKALVMEIEKLLLGSMQEGVITEKDVRELCHFSKESSLFQLLEYLLQKNGCMIANLLQSSLDIHDIGVVRFIKNQLEKLVVMEQSGEEGKTASQRRNASAARSLGLEKIFSWINGCRIYESEVRSGKREADADSLFVFFLSCIRE